ncbi:MAG: 4Fe-4S binding protein [Clostridia bacterium]|nr:4Fe-4S binding protein [Clostridia bacterium]
MENVTYNHSVSLNPDKCVGCTSCLKRCPTEVIRIRNGKAQINAEKCIDCGECIRMCTHKAKKAVYDHMDALDGFKWKIALPAPSLYGQFNNLYDLDYLIEGLYRLGFDDVYEVACAAEIVTGYTRHYLAQPGVKKPVISSACPAVVRLISLRYPELCDHLLPIKSPMEIAAIEARKKALREHPELKSEDIGIAFISPCPAKISFVKNRPAGDKTEVDVVLAMSEVYFAVLNVMNADEPPQHTSASGMIGVGWASSGGESTALFNEKYLAADGIENVIMVLDHLEDDSLSELEFIELNACNGGCSGGVLAVENPYIANARLTNLRRTLPIANNVIRNKDGDAVTLPEEYAMRPVEYIPGAPLGKTLGESLEKMAKIEKLYQRLPDHDCGSCGAPTCRAFAEDVVKGEVTEDECIVNMRSLIEELARNYRDDGDINTPAKEPKK